MKFLCALAFTICLIGTSATAQVNNHEQLSCEYSGGYFRVTDGLHRWEKYISASSTSNAKKVECGRGMAAAIIDSYFVVFNNGTFADKYVGSYSSNVLIVRSNMAAAVIGPYFLVARDGNAIQEKYVGTPKTTPLIAASKNVVISLFNPYFLASDGTQILDQYVGSSMSFPQILATNGFGAALADNYFLGFSGGKIIQEYTPGHRSAKDQIVRGSNLLCATVDSYFFVLDGHRNQITNTYLASGEKARIVNGIPVLEDNYGNMRRYNSASGNFESFRP